MIIDETNLERAFQVAHWSAARACHVQDHKAYMAAVQLCRALHHAHIQRLQMKPPSPGERN